MSQPRRLPMEVPSQHPQFVVGVDGGGTGSRAIVLDAHGREVGKAQGPPALIDPRNPGAAADAISETTRKALRVPGLTPPASALWTGLAGAGLAGAREAVEIALRSMGLAKETRVGMDVEGAHWDAYGSSAGVLISVGTGSVLWGRDPGGGEVRVGGWGTPLSEEGSGYWFGLEGLRAVVRSADQRASPTLLTPVLLDAVHLPEPRSLVGWISGASKAEVGALAPLVLQAARRGDAAAERILTQGLEALQQYLMVAKKAWEPWGGSFPLALAGGLLDEGAPLREPMLELVAAVGAELRPEAVIPARGAARLALALSSA